MNQKQEYNNTLNDKDAVAIEKLARNKLTEYNKLNDVIGTQIFQILELNCRVLYYPLEDDDVWGFLERADKDKFFVCINSSIPYDKQVFVAAHELYHIWFNPDDGEELILSANLEDHQSDRVSINENELKANRFAAAFLIDEGLLKQEMDTYSIEKESINIRQILKLANLFLVPYKTMVRRLLEINVINYSDFITYSEVSHQELEIWKTRLGIVLPKREKDIVLDKLIENAMLLYERKLITIDKLQQILDYSGLTLEQLGVKNETYVPPTDEELQEILGE